MLDTSNEWMNVSYENGNYLVWFAKSAAEFNISKNPYSTLIEVEFFGYSHYTDGINSPMRDNSSWSYPQSLIQRLDVLNASSETINSLSWLAVSPGVNGSVFSKVYHMSEEWSLSIGFRNNDQDLFVAVEVELPYANQSTQIFGQTYVPLYTQMRLEIDQDIPGAERSIRRLWATIFNDNVTGLFAGIQEVEQFMGPYPNNLDQGIWSPGDDSIPQEFPMAYIADMNAQNKYSIELATDLAVLNDEDHGNGTHGAELAVRAFFWVDYFSLKDWDYLVSLTNEQRGCTNTWNRCGFWRIPGKLWVGSDTVASQPQDFTLATVLYPIRNVTVSQDESLRLATVEARFLDEKPMVAELNYHLSGETAKVTSFQPSLEQDGFYYAEIPNLKKGDQVIYQITIRDRFNTTTISESDNFRFGKLSAYDGAVPANLGFALLGLLVMGVGKILSNRFE